MKYQISKIAQILGIHNNELFDADISILLTDSRKLSNPSETLFFAITTKNNDAHKYISELYNYGVKNIVISKTLPEWQQFEGANFLLVKNTVTALQKLASYHRSKFNYPVIGITGSNGKTIVKEWLYQLLGNDYNIVRSPRSYNSQVGVPLSVWEMSDKNDLAIFEAGVSQPDEMMRLEQIIKPTIGIFTELGEAHQENFTSMQQKCMEKLALFSNSDMFVYEEDNRVINQSVDLMVLSQKSYGWSKKNHDAPLFIQKIEKGEQSTNIHYSFLHLIVRVAGYSDNFNNLEKALQDEIIDRTEQNF